MPTTYDFIAQNKRRTWLLVLLLLIGDNDNGTVTNCGPAHTITLGTDVALANATTEVAIGSENTKS